MDYVTDTEILANYPSIKCKRLQCQRCSRNKFHKKSVRVVLLDGYYYDNPLVTLKCFECGMVSTYNGRLENDGDWKPKLNIFERYDAIKRRER